MRHEKSRLELATKICLGASLTSLAVVALLVNVAFYSTLADYWTVARLLGPAAVVITTLMAASFILGLVLHGVVVANGRRRASQERRVVHARPDVRRAA